MGNDDRLSIAESNRTRRQSTPKSSVETPWCVSFPKIVMPFEVYQFVVVYLEHLKSEGSRSVNEVSASAASAASAASTASAASAASAVSSFQSFRAYDGESYYLLSYRDNRFA
jgi:hypothetical protein